MRYFGIDLAWGDRARTGVAEVDDRGRLVGSASVRTDDEIAVFLEDASTDCVAAIDAPLIVPNDTGQRPCEREVGRLFGRYQASAYPANRGNAAFNPEPRGARLARRFGWDLDPAIRPHPDRAVAIEVYPHPAMVSTFGLSQVIPYKGKKGRDVQARQSAFADLLDRMEAVFGPLLHLDASPRWRELRLQVRDSPRPVDLDRVEDEVDAIFCAYLAWRWTHQAASMTVLGDVASGYIVTPLPPVLSDAPGAFRLDAEAGIIRFGDGAVGAAVPDGSDAGAPYRLGGGTGGNVAPTATGSAIGRLLDEISWEGNAKKYRGGGRHLENVLTTEVFSALDFLPRRHFLAPVLAGAEGARAATAAAASQVENTVVDVLPGDLTPQWLSGEDTGWRIQPDVLLNSPGTLVYVEAKAATAGKFPARQVARSLHATLHEAGDRTPLLLLVLDSPPPLMVKSHGRQSIADALELGLAGFPVEDAARLRGALSRSVAWTTWERIAASVENSRTTFANADRSVRGSVDRLASSVGTAIHPRA